jgi:hypothetical protein
MTPIFHSINHINITAAGWFNGLLGQLSVSRVAWVDIMAFTVCTVYTQSISHDSKVEVNRW